jgi:hypothetical protein
MIAFAHRKIAEEAASLRGQSEQDLMELLTELDSLSQELDARRIAIQHALRGKSVGASITETQYENSLEGFGIPTAIAYWLGKEGLGLRIVEDQLTKYSRVFLEQQLRLLSDRRMSVQNAEPLTDDEIKEMLDAVEGILHEHNLSLAQ